MTEQNTKKRILNDHCLLMIIEKLSLKDLVRAAQVSKQFNALAKRTVELKYPYVKFKRHFKYVPYSLYKTFFELFAENIRGLSLNTLYLEQSITMEQNKYIELIIEYYQNKKMTKLESLELENFDYISSFIFYDLFPILNSLEKLHLTHVSLSVSTTFLILTLPNLKKLTLYCCEKLNENNDNVSKFIRDNFLNRIRRYQTSNITELKLMHNSNIGAIPVLTTLHKTMPKLKHLTFQQNLLNEPVSSQIIFSRALSNVADISTLSCLNINLNFRSMSPLIEIVASNLPNLESLEISYAEFNPNIIKSFLKLKNLKQLKLLSINKLKRFHLKPIARNLKNLNSLQSDCFIHIRNLTHIMRVAPKLTSLIITIKRKQKLKRKKIEQLNQIAESQQKDNIMMLRILDSDVGLFNYFMDFYWHLSDTIKKSHIHIETSHCFNVITD